MLKHHTFFNLFVNQFFLLKQIITFLTLLQSMPINLQQQFVRSKFRIFLFFFYRQIGNFNNVEITLVVNNFIIFIIIIFWHLFFRHTSGLEKGINVVLWISTLERNISKSSKNIIKERKTEGSNSGPWDENANNEAVMFYEMKIISIHEHTKART